MVEISASMVKDLRDKSGAAMMDCKKALVDSNGDSDKAFELLRQKGVAQASKKSSRVASEGLVAGATTPDGRVGALIEINCETDFVARNDQFVGLTKELVDLVLKNKVTEVDKFLAQKAGAKTINEVLTEAIAKTGENMVIRRIACLDLKSAHGVVGLYVHALGGKMGALLELESNKQADVNELAKIARDIAMHVVSAKPQYLSRNDVDAEVIENERRIESGKADLADKKPEIREKIVTGRVDKILAERCLTEQPFVKDPSLTVGKYLAQKGKDLGGIELKPTHMALFILGEVTAETNGKE